MSTQENRRRRRRLVLIAGVVTSAVVVWQSSYAAFMGTTSNGSNAWTTGQLALTATNGSGTNITGSAVFNASGMKPGAAALVRCITVVYTGNLTPGSAVKLYTASSSSSTAVNAHTLSSYLNVAIESGSGATDTACANFASSATIFNASTNNGPVSSASVLAGSLMDLSTNKTTFANGIDTGWTPSVNNETKSFRFTVSFPGSGSNTTDTDLMGMTASTTFTWEAQS